jgi:hypothetical protein
MLATVKTDILAADGREEVLTEWLCDWPECPNIADHVLGSVREIGASVVLCAQHAATIHSRIQSSADSG